jgi:hypothetical protein
VQLSPSLIYPLLCHISLGRWVCGWVGLIERPPTEQDTGVAIDILDAMLSYIKCSFFLARKHE